jgi:hypothetical protein
MTNALSSGLGLAGILGSPFGSWTPTASPYAAGLGLAPMPQPTYWNWQGASLVWYPHLILPFNESTTISGANYIMVRRLNGSRAAIYIGQSNALSDRLPNHEKFAAAQRLGANELHVYSGATSSSERFRVETDLRNAGHNPPLNEQGSRPVTNALSEYPYSSALARALALSSVKPR